jgi:hypothetical protein
VCAPANGSPFTACIAQAGEQTCTGGYPVIHPAGTKLVDTRGCSACTACTPSATCANASVTFYTSNDCSTGGVAIVADGNCHQNSQPGPGYNSYKYTATMQNPICVPGASSPTGSIALDNASTICCAN